MGFFQRLSKRFSQWMAGRNGADTFSNFLLIIAIILLILASIFGGAIFWAFGLACIIWAFFRILSRNIPKRAQENESFVALIEKPRNGIRHLIMRLRNRKTTVYFKCENCGTILAVPRGKGKIRTTCPKCHDQRIRKT